MLHHRNLASPDDTFNKSRINEENNCRLTWPAAYRIADTQVAYWRRTGITADEAQRALLQCDFPAAWDDVRRMLAAWAMLHKARWEE